MKFLLWFAFITTIVFSVGCTYTGKKETQKQPAEKIIIETYQKNGKTYYVKESRKSFKQRGQASWYGQAFHGRRTASGEKFNMHAMTAAHPTLPLSTYVRVTNLENGESAVVRINDRMPKHKNRIIDVSYAASKELGMYRAGLVQVEVERVYLRER